MNRLSKLLLVASITLMIAGIGLAVAQPGSLGDDDASGPIPLGASTTTIDGGDDEQAGGATTTSPTTAAPTTSAPAPTPTSPATTAPGDGVGSGSGVGSDGTGSGSDSSDSLADTGGESMIVAGMLLGAVGVALRSHRRATRLR